MSIINNNSKIQLFYKSNTKLDENNLRNKKKLTVAMISDFFYPRLGGVEVSIYQLSCSLIRRGIKVVVITRAYKNRQIIRYMGNGVKVYYLPVAVLNNEIMFPTLYGLLPILREIIQKEGIDIIHMHQVKIIILRFEKYFFKFYKYLKLGK